MEKKEFLNKMAETLEIEDLSLLNFETKFRELDEWDSLTYLSVIAMLDEEYSCQIESAEFKKLQTIEDIFNTIKK